MSKQIKLRCCLFFMDLNHPIAEAVFFHWLNLAVLMILLLILSRILLLIFPISDLVGLISRHDKYIYIYINIYMVLSSKINHLYLIIFSKRIEHMFEPELKTAFLAYTIFRLRSSHVSFAINDKGFVLFLPLLIASKRRLTVSFFAWQNPNA